MRRVKCGVGGSHSSSSDEEEEEDEPEDELRQNRQPAQVELEREEPCVELPVEVDDDKEEPDEAPSRRRLWRRTVRQTDLTRDLADRTVLLVRPEATDLGALLRLRLPRVGAGV